MSSPIRIGVIGLGHWGPNIVRSFQYSPDSQVVVICDRDESRLRTVAEVFPQVRTTSMPENVIGGDDVDAVVIATPTATHYDLARAALRSGKHVFVEKPVATTSAQADEILKLAGSSDRIVLTGHVFLYNGAVRHLRQIVAAPEFGDIVYLHARRTNLGPIREDVHAGWDLASHDLAVFLYLKGEMPVEVTASAQEVIRHGLPDVVFATLYFEDGTLAHLHTSWLDPQKVRELTVVGTKRMAVFDDMNLMEPLRVYDRSVRRQADEREDSVVDTFGSFRVELVQGDVVIPRVSTGEPLRQECQAFLDAIRSNQAPISGARLGLDVVRLLEAMDRSIADHSRRAAVE